MKNIKIKYLNVCPIDNKPAKIEEILSYGECQESYQQFKKKFWQLIKENNCQSLAFASNFCYLYRQLKKFKKFFNSRFKSRPLKLQLYWAKRFFLGQSFSIIAPTGFGKTTFGLSLANFVQGKVYYLVPTTILLREIKTRFEQLKLNKKILTIEKTKDKEKLKENFDVLITTSQFLHKNFDLLPKDFSLVFIDDADSMIRQPRNIDKVLKLVGFSEKDIANALKIIDSKRAGDFLAVDNFRREIDFTNKGQVIAASATLSPRTKRINLFRELLGFEIGTASTYLRNIKDIVEIVSQDELLEKAVFWIKKLGKGGFVFLNSDFRKEDLLRIIDFFAHQGIRSISYEKFNQTTINLLAQGEIDVVIGFSNIKNPLTRGIDLPHLVRYAIFVGLPKFKIQLKPSWAPANLLLLLLALQEFFEDKITFRHNLLYLRKYSFLKEDDILKNERLKKRIGEIRASLEKLLADPSFKEKISHHPLLVIEKINGENNLIVSDPRGYIQASGRTSRLFPLGLTQGLSLVLAENSKLLAQLKYKLRVLGYKIDFLEPEEELIRETLAKIDADREVVKKFLAGETLKFKDPISTCLIIVESPTKAKTIANFFGKPTKRKYHNFYVYEVSLGSYLINIIATLGHFVDLPHKIAYYGVEKENNYFVPVFQPIKICLNCSRNIDLDETECLVCKSKNFMEKETLINVLKNLAIEVDEIYLATDPDSEGEKIAFDLYAYLYPFNQKIKRIEFHEITREEFWRRFNQPRKIKFSLVQSQLLRRISDRWVGFYLSGDIQKRFKNLNLSAGRVQTPVLGWTINREVERKKKYYNLRLTLNNGSYLNLNLDDKELVKVFKNNRDDLEIVVRYKKIKSEIKNPPPPLQTSDLLKESWNLLKFNAQTTMELAQSLFERGFITYHRTDSNYVSNFGRDLAKEYLGKIKKENIFLPRSWGKPGTHEAIRPTKPLNVGEIIEENILTGQQPLSPRELKLYSLIFNRFLASQAKASLVDQAKVEIKVKLKGKTIFNKVDNYIIRLKEKGYLEFFQNIFPYGLEEGNYQVKEISTKRFPQVPPYTGASLIEEMKNRGLGRPSTYSNIIQTLLNRKFLITNKGFLIPTTLGKKIYSYLAENYFDLINEDFTKSLENNMDLVERGKLDYQKVLIDLFNKLFNNK